MSKTDTAQREGDRPAEAAVQVGQAPSGVSKAARVLIGLLLGAAVVVLLAMDAALPSGVVYAAAGAAAVALALGEFTTLAGRVGFAMDRQLLVLGGTGLFLLQWAGWAAPAAFPDPWLVGLGAAALLLMAMLTGRALRGETAGALEGVSVALAGLVYVPLLMGFLTAARLQWGMAAVLGVLLVCKVGSTGAYFVGTAVGGPRLAPRISPNKTIAGAVGQVLAGVGAAYVLSLSPWALMSPQQALFYGLVISLAAIMGDLAESLLKRQAGLKDSGRVPGMGGMLDMLDDVLFAAPVSYVFLACFAQAV